MNDIYEYCCDQFVKGYEEITLNESMRVAHRIKTCMCDYYCKHKENVDKFAITKEQFNYECSRCPLAEVKEMYI